MLVSEMLEICSKSKEILGLEIIYQDSSLQKLVIYRKTSANENFNLVSDKTKPKPKQTLTPKNPEQNKAPERITWI